MPSATLTSIRPSWLAHQQATTNTLLQHSVQPLVKPAAGRFFELWAYWGLKFQILIFCSVHYFNFLSPPICDPCGHYILVPLKECGIWTWSLVVARRVLPMPLLMATADIGYTSTNTHMTGRDSRGLDWSICGHSLGGINIIIIITVLVVLFCLSTPLSPNAQHPYKSPPQPPHRPRPSPTGIL